MLLAMPCALAQDGDPSPARAAAPPIPSALELAGLPEAVIAHRDGREIQGEILEEDGYRLILNLNGIRTEVLRVDINSMRRLRSALERYQTVRGSIPQSDVESRLALIEWLRRRKLYAQALDEVGVVLQADPANPSGLRTRTWLEAQIRLQRVAPAADPDEGGNAQSLDVIRTRGARTTAQADLPTLTKEQINRIRVYEVDLDHPPRMVVSRETIERLFAGYGASAMMPQTVSGREALARRPAHEILELMFKLKAREMYPEIRVLSDPASLKTFRDRIHGRGGWLINSCGSVRCHGGLESGPFQLVTKRAFSDEAVYTNFYILDNFTLSDGTPLIDFDEPDRSPLLLMATRRDNSAHPHPETKAERGPLAWRPIFNSTEDPGFRTAASWIRSLYRPRPDYGIDYALPGQTVETVSEPVNAPFGGPSPPQVAKPYTPAETTDSSEPSPAADSKSTPELDAESEPPEGTEQPADGDEGQDPAPSRQPDPQPRAPSEEDDPATASETGDRPGGQSGSSG